MNVVDLDKLFEIMQYRPNFTSRASVELVDGTVRLRFPMTFLSEAGTESPVVLVNAVATQQQLDQMKMFLTGILQATTMAIEAEHGWTRYIEPEEVSEEEL